MLDKNDILGNLNDRQSEAVETTEGHVRVVAGAGSGKTRVLAHRYAFLVNELGIDPGNILCMTFTNKAAQEMKRRISKLVHRGNVNDFVCTIHGFGPVGSLTWYDYIVGRSPLLLISPDEIPLL